METKANYALVGAFAVGAVLAILLFAMWLAQSQFNREYARYDIVFEGAVRGLARGAEVRFNGIKVGEVTQLNINPDNPTQVVARIRVDGQTPA
jgi:phospholipid/cholesterol/gamma-HCH transport system substrate-binding protein